MQEFITALGLILVIEGGLYAAFPSAMKRAMVIIQAQPSDYLRTAGFAAAIMGIGIVWAVEKLS